MKKKMHRITLEDSFSFAVKSFDVGITDEQYNTTLRQIENKEIVIRTFNDGINWAWRVKSIKEI